MTYSELQTNVIGYLHRSDLAAKLPSFIALAESFLFRELQIKKLQLSVTGTTTGEYADLPSDFGTLSRLTTTIGGRESSLDYKAQPESEHRTHPDSFALENDKLRIWGAGTGQAFKLYYIPNVQPLSASVPTNWLLENAYDLYFYATALEAARHVRNDAQVASIQPLIPTLLDSARNFANRRAQPVTGSMQIKAR